jgi:hypothetical protein
MSIQNPGSPNYHTRYHYVRTDEKGIDEYAPSGPIAQTPWEKAQPELYRRADLWGVPASEILLDRVAGQRDRYVVDRQNGR